MKRARRALGSGLRLILVLLALLGLFGCDPGNEQCEPSAFYGPPPCTEDQDCIDANGAGWYCDSENTFDDGCGNQVSWWLCKSTDCEPAVYYGPPPCTDDQECIDANGAGWFCDDANTFSDGCGNDQVYPVCRETSCEPATYYGPPPCAGDQECIDENGAGWYCDETNTFTDNCDNTYTFPVCKESCEPAAYYGPPPCTDDQGCIDAYGAGWYCDQANTFDDGCGNQASWPVCKQTP